MTFLKKRIARIYPSYILLSLPILIYMTTKTDSIVYLLHNVSLIAFYNWVPYSPDFNFVRSANASPVAWTLYYEMLFYVIFSLSKIFFNEKLKVALSTALTILMLLVCFNLIYGNLGELGWDNVSYIGICSNLSLLSFIAGMACPFFWYKKNNKSVPWLVLFIPVMSWFMLNASARLFSEAVLSQQMKALLFSSIPSWFFVSVLITRIDLQGKVASLLHWLGMISYSLYVVHANFYLIKKVFSIEAMPVLYQLIFFAVSLMLSVLFATVSYNMIEKRFTVKRAISNAS
ncbi:acyltransferase [Salmonella enterica]|nr:acyltransferase [Salmonella enterica]EGD3282698.1 acyltransferase [Salmonella enterica]EKK1207665.1 acyltransferase [Salmonella enterica]EKK6283513.1 acyltransferase [Salmonella enterica]